MPQCPDWGLGARPALTHMVSRGLAVLIPTFQSRGGSCPLGDLRLPAEGHSACGAEQGLWGGSQAARGREPCQPGGGSLMEHSGDSLGQWTGREDRGLPPSASCCTKAMMTLSPQKPCRALQSSAHSLPHSTYENRAPGHVLMCFLAILAECSL